MASAVRAAGDAVVRGGEGFTRLSQLGIDQMREYRELMDVRPGHRAEEARTAEVVFHLLRGVGLDREVAGEAAEVSDRETVAYASLDSDIRHP